MNVVVDCNILCSLCFFEIKGCLLICDNGFLKIDLWMLVDFGEKSFFWGESFWYVEVVG